MPCRATARTQERRERNRSRGAPSSLEKLGGKTARHQQTRRLRAQLWRKSKFGLPRVPFMRTDPATCMQWETPPENSQKENREEKCRARHFENGPILVAILRPRETLGGSKVRFSTENECNMQTHNRVTPKALWMRAAWLSLFFTYHFEQTLWFYHGTQVPSMRSF